MNFLPMLITSGIPAFNSLIQLALWMSPADSRPWAESLLTRISPRDDAPAPVTTGSPQAPQGGTLLVRGASTASLSSMSARGAPTLSSAPSGTAPTLSRLLPASQMRQGPSILEEYPAWLQLRRQVHV